MRSFDQNSKSTLFDKVFNNMSTKLNINSNEGEILADNFEIIKKHRTKLEKEYDSQFEDYRDFAESEI